MRCFTLHKIKKNMHRKQNVLCGEVFSSQWQPTGSDDGFYSFQFRVAAKPEVLHLSQVTNSLSTTNQPAWKGLMENQNRSHFTPTRGRLCGPGGRPVVVFNESQLVESSNLIQPDIGTAADCRLRMESANRGKPLLELGIVYM